MDTSILHTELKFKSSRSSGSGGQHVNKVATRISLAFDVEASVHLSDTQKKYIKKKLNHKINKEGILALDCSETRSQYRNKQLVVEQFDQLILEAIKPPKRRKKVPKARQANAKERLEKKRRKSEKKALRGKVRL